MIAAAHSIPYVATASIAFPADLRKKVKKGLEKTPAFLHIFAPCPTGWRIPSERTIELARIAVETGIFPLYEITCDAPLIPKITKKRKEGKKVEDYLKTQGRFKHLFKPKKQTDVLLRLQKEVDEKWKWLEELNEMAR
jgi:pyruvate ferredoxin oxidoreductase beta subunit